jgi:hypothetical protein
LRVIIKSPEDAAIGEIDLNAHLAELMEIGHAYVWPGAQTVMAVNEGLIRFGKAPETDEMFFEWLLSVQVGLTLVCVLRGRLRPRQPGQDDKGPVALRDLGDLNEIALEDGSSAYLAVWDPFLLPGEVEAAAGTTGHVELRAPLNRLRTLGGVSALILKGGPDGKVALSREEIALFSAPQITRPLEVGVWDPIPKGGSRILQPVSRETASLLRTPWSGRGRPPKGVSVPKKVPVFKRPPRMIRSGAGWADPFLPIFRCGVPVPPPLAALDGIAVELCERVRLRAGGDRTQSKIAHALSAAYRIGTDPERINLTRASPIHPNMSGFLRDRSHAIGSVFPEGGSVEEGFS